ncbi:MAG: FtsX-like permease family protein [Syntrophaceticus sp.]|jgi:putative ABC transport system permease protein|nr:FtsX-like permease family protein [Syntrophaceticus sp.]MDD3314968.1 FtsX-like permease family protein [Syntrophaceticus sp.]MDD4359181.1 FtsX-like permease family protein [Syntrophaceticus sp.]MDD4782066.1 FtsX-like permease family protein [Syntrophaceticus sp.]
MNIINTLTLRHLKLNKQRTIVTIIGVILSVAMITAVATFVSSFLDMTRREVIENTGNWHVLYRDIQSQNIDSVINDKNTASAALSKDIGYALLDGSKNEDKPYLFLQAYDEQSIETFNLDLVEGHFPQNSNEIVISSHIAENGGVTYKVGDKIKVDVGQRYMADGAEEVLLRQDSEFKKQDEDNSGEKLIVESAKEYTVTGIISRPGFEPYWAPGYTVITYLDKNEFAPAETVNISVTWNQISKKANEQANELAANIGVSDVSYNRDLLRLYGIIDDNLLTTLYTLAAVAIILIIIGSVALIYNAFAISISERSRHLGMLASVGATKRQKRNSVFFESFVVGIIGIPLGIFFGTLGMGITFVLVQPLITSVSGTSAKLTLVTSPATILVAVLFSMLTIFISAYIPAKRASQISPIEAIRQTRDIKFDAKNVKTSKLTRLIFGFEAELGLKNLKRNSRRYKITVFSLVLSIVLFLSVSSLSLLSQQSTDLMLSSSPYDVSLFVTSSATAQEKKDFYAAIAKLDDVEESVITETMPAMAVLDRDLVSDELKKMQNEIMQPNDQEQNTEEFETYIDIKSIDDQSLKRYAHETGADVARLKDAENPCGILVNTLPMQKIDNKYSRSKRFDIETGDKLSIKFIAYGPNDDNIDLEIAALADEMPMGDVTMLNGSIQAPLIVSEKAFAVLKGRDGSDYSYVNMYINSSDPTSLVENIKEYQKQTSIADLNINDVAASNKRNEQYNTLIAVFFYGFVALIAAICVANIFNTISTSIALRKREFAMLKSIGMTPKGFNKMINYESLFYGLKALLYGLPISLGIMYLNYRILGNSFSLPFTLPWSSIIAAIIAVFAIVGATMLYSSSKLKKENIIDVLKNENI